jgi:hypothetical protein
MWDTNLPESEGVEELVHRTLLLLDELVHDSVTHTAFTHMNLDLPTTTSRKRVREFIERIFSFRHYIHIKWCNARLNQIL